MSSDRVRLPLDTADVHAVVASREGSELHLSLEHAAGDRRSRAHEALARQLRILSGDATVPFDSAACARAPIGGGARLVALLDGEPPLVVAELGVSGRALRGRSRYQLSPFELRYAADAGRLHPVPPGARSVAEIPTPTTDLHTHFAGCVRGAELVALGAAHGVAYPRPLLEEAGARPSGGAGDVPLDELPEPVRARLGERLEVPLDRCVTFLEMERVYRLRAPITKSPRMFVPLCRAIARDYAAMGVRHVELSLSSIVEAPTLRVVHRELPAIEEESGVTMRFLAAISRHDDLEWDLDLIERIKALAGSAYLVGVDFMGHETNSTNAFAAQLRALATWAAARRPGFVIRVHAGESPAHPENVRLALEAVPEPEIELRLGHGLYGVDDATLEALVRRGAVVEFNLDSNVALNHLQSARAVPIRRYVRAGARVVLGTDGYGLYGTSAAATARAALLAGLAVEDLAGPVREAERACVERARAFAAAASRSFVVPDDAPPVHFGPEVEERRRAAVRARDSALSERLSRVGLEPVDAGSVPDVVAGRRVVAIGGAWTRSWEAMPEAQREHVGHVLEAVLDALEPSRTVLVTGGTRFGVEGLVGALAVARGFTVIAALVRETPPDALESGSATHACFVGETLYDKAAGLYALVARTGGVCLFVGGGQIVSDEIQVAANLRLPHLLMTGIEGASARHAAERPAHAFRTAAEAIHALRALEGAGDACAPHWFEGPNPTVDAVVLRDGPPRELLLVRRHPDAPAEPGRWALPGGFVRTTAPRGARFQGDVETEEEACLRELREETGLLLEADALVRVGVYSGGGRDPRDTPRSHSRSTAFVVRLPEGGETVLAAGDDAEDVRWFRLDALPPLAFDHARIVEDALARLSAG